jgi:O-antigen/teichoic acid export membrane protein
MLWATLLNVIGWQIPPLLFSAWFSAEVAGLYGLTIRMLGIPAMLIGQAVAQVFYPTAAAEKDDHKQRRLVEQLSSVLLTISISIFAIVFSHAPILFTWVFGAEWQTAGEYAQWLAPWMLLSFVSSPLSSFALVKSRQRTIFWFTVYETSLRLAVLSIGIYFGSAFLAIAGFAAAGIVISLIYIAWILHLAGSNLWTWMWHLRWILLLGSGLWGITWWSVQMFQPVISLSMSIVLSLAFLGFAWQSMKHDFVE